MSHPLQDDTYHIPTNEFNYTFKKFGAQIQNNHNWKKLKGSRSFI